MEIRFKYHKGEKVTVLNIRGEVAGKGVVESYDINRHSYKVWFCYPNKEDREERELVELPALLVASESIHKIFARESKKSAGKSK